MRGLCAVLQGNNACLGQRKTGLLFFQLKIFTKLFVFLFQLLQCSELLTQSGELLIGLAQLLLQFFIVITACQCV